MRRSFFQSAVLAVLSLVSVTTSADDKPDFMFTIQGLYQFCNGPANTREYLMCITYIGGVKDTMGIAGIERNGQPLDATQKLMGICPHSGDTYGAAVQAFKNYAEKHPEMWGQPRAAGVLLALQDIWPCS